MDTSFNRNFHSIHISEIMKTRNILTWCFLLFTLASFGQKVKVADVLIVNDQATINGVTFTDIVTDTSLTNASDSQIPTAKAVKDYVTNNAGSGGAATVTGDTVTMLVYGSSYAHNNSDTTNTAGVYWIDSRVRAFDYRRGTLGTMVQDTALCSGCYLNNPPQTIGSADGTGIDRFPRNTTWANHFAREFINEDKYRLVYMMTAGKGGVSSDSLFYAPYIDSLAGYLADAEDANTVYSYYDYILLGLGPMEINYSFEAKLLYFRDLMINTYNVADEHTIFVLKDAPVEVPSNVEYNITLPGLIDKYPWLKIVTGTKDFTTFDGIHPTAAQLQDIGKIAYDAVIHGVRTPYDRGNIAVGKASVYGLGGAETKGNYIQMPSGLPAVGLDSLVETIIISPDSISIATYLRRVHIFGSNYQLAAALNGVQNIMVWGWDNHNGATLTRDSVITIGWNNGQAGSKAFNVIGGSWNSSTHNFNDFVLCKGIESPAHGAKHLFRGVSGLSLYVGDNSWIFNIDDAPAEGEYMRFVSGEFVGSTGPTNAEIETAYNAQVAQVSGAERTAGTETAIRRFSPADIASMAGTHGGGGSGIVESYFNDTLTTTLSDNVEYFITWNREYIPSAIASLSVTGDSIIIAHDGYLDIHMTVNTDHPSSIYRAEYIVKIYKDTGSGAVMQHTDHSFVGLSSLGAGTDVGKSLFCSIPVSTGDIIRGSITIDWSTGDATLQGSLTTIKLTAK